METTIATATTTALQYANEFLNSEKRTRLNFLEADHLAQEVACKLTNQGTAFAFWLWNEKKAGRDLSIDEGRMYRTIFFEAEAKIREIALQEILSKGLVPNCKLARNFINKKSN